MHILACRDREELLLQLIDSNANVNFSQGLDARFITPEIAELLKQVKKKRVHFAFDYVKNEKAIIKGLEIYKNNVGGEDIKRIVYILTNQDRYVLFRKASFYPNLYDRFPCRSQS